MNQAVIVKSRGTSTLRSERGGQGPNCLKLEIEVDDSMSSSCDKESSEVFVAGCCSCVVV